ncbi:MAG: hypothetical protein ACR2LQ_06960 [Acidimicrobiales bacterium]
MEPLLLLLEAPDANWKLDEKTKELGLRNVAKAREVLAEARKAALAQRQANDAARHAA